MKTRVCCIVVVLLGAFLDVPAALAWGTDGHRIVAQIAAEMLTPAARARVQALLGNETLPDVANWADRIRSESEYRWSAPLHYVNLPPGATAYDPQRDCPRGACVVAAIERFAAVLRSPESPREKQREALLFLVHFVGDIHQPLHVSHARDKGGNDVAVDFFGNRTNLHTVWDSMMIRRAGKRWSVYARDLLLAVTPQQRAEWAAQLDPAVWAMESFRLAESNGYAVPKDGVIDDAYFQKNLPVIDTQLTKGGVRLGALLNAIFAGAATTASAPAESSGPAEVLELWPGGAPGAIGHEDADVPTLTVYRPGAKSIGTALVICPGGGYRHLAMDHEGRQIAAWANSHGVTAFILKHRHAPRYGHPAPMQDVQRAIRTVRARAREWGVGADRIGIIGFSAGGHLASTAGTHFDAGRADAEDPIERVSSRPDFMILCYPVISMAEGYSHGGSRRNLLGPEPAPELVELLSNERRVTAQTPPTFIFHTHDDPVVPVENATAFYLALKRAGVPAELHIYEHGPHGVGLAQKDPVLATWVGRCEDWLRAHGWLGK